MTKTLFITTGATVTFHELIDIVLDQQFLEVLIELGFTRSILQYGSSTKGKQQFEQRLESIGLEKKLQQLNDDRSIYQYRDGLIIEGFGFTSDITSVILQSDLIISHAGTGSILDTLRLEKDLIVVINPKLMDNHQAEIADELFKGGYLLESLPDLSQLIGKVKQIDNVTLKRFPEPNTKIISQIISEL